MKYKQLAIFTLLSICSSMVKAQSADLKSSPGYSSVVKAIENYVDGLYNVDSTLIRMSVHPELRKRGFWFNAEKKDYVNHVDMTYNQLVALSTTWNKNGDRATADSPKIIEVYDVTDKTASGKLIAEWGIDYFHLCKLDGKWMIMNILWQSHPRK